MSGKLTLITLLVAALTAQISAQETWTLQECINYARQNNLQVKQAQATVQSNELTLKQNQFNRLPNLRATASYGNNFGLSVNPLTNTLTNVSIGFNNISVSAGMTVFSGNQINNRIKQSKMLLEAAQLDAADAENTLALDIATAYLNILLGQEQLENAETQLELSQAQLDQIDRLIRAGARPENERFDLLAQIARNEQTIIDAQNSIALNYLSLKQLMNLDPNTDMQIASPEVTIPAQDPDEFNLNEVFVAALGTQPQIRANDLRMQSAETGVDIAKGAYYPTVSLFGNLDTRYSTEGQQPTGEVNIVRQSTDVIINGEPSVLEQDVPRPVFEKSPYFDQLNNNFGQSFGLSLNIPIFNNLQNRIGVQRARLDVITTEVQNEQVRQQLKTNIQQAIANARAAKRSYDAAERSVEAAQIAFDNAQKQFELGAINTFDYTTARNNLDQAQISLIQAKYQLFFNVKVVDFYLGRPIVIER
jgi:outer membrane protein